MADTQQVLTAKDFALDVEVKWCPGCGDYSILKQVQSVFPQLGIPREKFAIISGIGCSSRFPYYMNVYGVHTIHGRAAAIASGLKCARPDLSVWLVTGDGDSFSIGGNHTIHLLRRNIDINVLLFNNEIYGLTKGQYSPTSAFHKVTKTSPYGSIDYPFNTAALALGARASFFARSMDRDPKHLQQMMLKAHQHEGTSLVEIYQNCVIFNDGNFDMFTEKDSKAEHSIFVEEGKPLTFGKNHEKGIILDGNTPKVVDLEKDKISVNDLWIHNSKDYHKAQALASFADSTELPRPFGVFYDVQRPVYNELMYEQIDEVIKTKGTMTPEEVLAGHETWEVK